MNEEKDKEKIACHICRKMIPASTALQAEGQDYVYHFCDTSCLDLWSRDKEQGRDEDKNPDRDPT